MIEKSHLVHCYIRLWGMDTEEGRSATHRSLKCGDSEDYWKSHGHSEKKLMNGYWKSSMKRYNYWTIWRHRKSDTMDMSWRSLAVWRKTLYYRIKRKAEKEMDRAYRGHSRLDWFKYQHSIARLRLLKTDTDGIMFCSNPPGGRH